MSVLLNQFEQPIGKPIYDWTARKLPEDITIHGEHCIVESLDVNKHSEDLFRAYNASPDSIWTYLPSEPLRTFVELKSYLEDLTKLPVSKTYAIINKTTGKAVGTFSLIRTDTNNGVIEVGYVLFSKDMQRTPISTEAHYLLMNYIFEDLGYRRYEWKCDSLNKPSGNAAQRLGFKPEGTFRNAMIYKQRTRDTCWFSIIDEEWAVARTALKNWLSNNNFDQAGKQLETLQEIRSRL
ncbi:hypothetical protein KDRO_D02650 [Kluyveromyces lactis]|nr:hypothetical protein KDRO_D02650 [Kluyveromyces lactis]